MIGLIDCNSYYCSVERIFSPSSRNRPVIVLSNQDGCIVSLSIEAKALGIKMGTPLFQIKDIVKQHKVDVFSSNYSLYGDISSRVMEVISTIVPPDMVKQYSIDECFLTLADYPTDQLESMSFRVRERIGKWVGIPVSIGIGKTKVLAKVANKIAKKSATGICILYNETDTAQALANFPVEDLWGIGRRYAEKLHMNNIYSALQLKSMPQQWLSKHLTINGVRIGMELNGFNCIPFELMGRTRSAIGSAKGFGKPVTTFDELREAVATYTANCAFKLRKQNDSASVIDIFLQTNFFSKTDAQYSKHISIHLPSPTALTPELIGYAVHGLKKIFLEGYKYKRVGVLLTGFVKSNSIQANLFSKYDTGRLERAQVVIDSINKKFPRNQVQFAAQGFEKPWTMKQEMLSKRYTTRLDEILEIKM